MGKRKAGVKKGSAQARTYSAEKRNEEIVFSLKLIAIAEQQILDCVQMTLSEEFGFGPDRQKRFHDKFEETYGTLKKIEREDAPDGVYYRETVERVLRTALGKHYVPREERYDIRIIDKFGREWRAKE